MNSKKFIPAVLAIVLSVYLLHFSATSFALNSSPREINKTEPFLLAAQKIVADKVLDISGEG